MNIKSYSIKRRCENPKFLVVVTCQGQSFYYQHHTVFGAVIDFIHQYLMKKKYGTMNFSLREVFVTDIFEVENVYKNGERRMY